MTEYCILVPGMTEPGKLELRACLLLTSRIISYMNIKQRDNYIYTFIWCKISISKLVYVIIYSLKCKRCFKLYEVVVALPECLTFSRFI